MPDALVEQLRARLDDVAELAPLELEPPLDLERRVQRVRRRSRTRGLLTGLSVAAVLLAAIATIAVVERAPARGTVAVDAPGRAAADPIFEDVVMLDARGPFVVALDDGGHQRATLVAAKRGNIVDAQLTADHRTLWYLSAAGRPGVDCGEVVRADLHTGVSKIVTHAASFAISPDGGRLALAGPCVPGTVIRDLSSGASSSLPVLATSFAPMRWSPDGAYVLTRPCLTRCAPLTAIDVPGSLGRSLRTRVVDRDGITGAFAPNGLYVLRRDAVVLNGTKLLALDFGWELAEVVPTYAGTFVVAAPPGGPRALYRIDNGRLVLLQTFNYGTLTRVP